MSYKKENIDGYYNENDKEYPYTLEVIIRDETRRNDTFEIVWENDFPDNNEDVEERLVDEYFKNKNAGNLSQNKLEKTVDALLDGLTCTWENNGNIMADTVRDDVLNVLTEVTGKTFEEIEEIVLQRIQNKQ
jgi:hypothetical protein